MLPVNLSSLAIDAAPPIFLDLLALPRPLALTILARLPVDTRLRCSEVNRAWRVLLADTSLWRRLNLSTDSGISRFSEALFCAAIAKAGGKLRVLDVSRRGNELLPPPTLLHAVTSNAASLKLLFAPPNCYKSAEVVGFLTAAPRSFFHLSTTADSVEQARRCARKEPPYDRLRLYGLDIKAKGQLDSLESLEALCTDLLKHSFLVHFFIRCASIGTAAAMRVFVNAAIALRVQAIGLVRCRCTRACVPELTRLVSAGMLKVMVISNRNVELFEDGADTDDLYEAFPRLFLQTFYCSRRCTAGAPECRDRSRNNVLQAPCDCVTFRGGPIGIGGAKR